jgi:putative transposase
MSLLSLVEMTCPPKTGPGLKLVLEMFTWTKKGDFGMGKKRYTTEQIIVKLREAEVELSRGKSVVAACRQIGITDQTYYRWRKEYGGLKLDQAKRFKDLENENVRLKRIVADLTLDNQILRETLKGKY